jgi:hypothetical protein
VLFREIFDRYRLPMTMSVIEGEVGKAGMYPQLSAELEPIARKIFAQPYVEVASHVFASVRMAAPWRARATPRWWRATRTTTQRIPGYRMDLNREIGGSIDYINACCRPTSR